MGAAERLSDDQLDGLFHALAATPRRRILADLKNGGRRVTDVAEQFDLSLNAVSKHIKVLERVGLVERHVQGRVHLVELRPKKLAQAQKWFFAYQNFWEDRLERLNQFVTRSGKRKDKK